MKADDKTTTKCPTCKGEGVVWKSEPTELPSGYTYNRQRKAECPGEGCVQGRVAKPGFKIVPCRGQAHDPEVGGQIDNCASCAPMWGWVAETMETT